MKRNICRTSTVVRMLVIVSLLIASGLQASAQEKSKTQSAATQKSEKTTDRAGGPQESIKVHGHWTIVIRNGDGSVASRHEFNNALQDGSFLAKLLSREASVFQNSYSIRLNGPQGSGVCSFLFRETRTPAACTIHEGPGSNDDSNFYGLTATVASQNLRLTGSARAFYPGTITSVSTGLQYCVTGTSSCP